MRSKKIIKQKLRYIYDSVTSKKIKIGIGDVLLPRGGVSYIQMIAVGRYLDTLAYCKGNDTSFFIKNTIGTVTREDFDVLSGDKKFINLIESYMRNGYDGSSRILTDKKLCIINGTHRLGLHLYLKIPVISALVKKRAECVDTGVDFLFKKGVYTDVLKSLQEGHGFVVEKLAELGQCFTIIVKGPLSDDKISLKDDISILSHVICSYSNDVSHTDELVTLFQVWFECPDYVVDNHGEYRSNRALEIESLLEERVSCRQLRTEVKVSKNCIEGMQWFLSYRDLLNKNN